MEISGLTDYGFVCLVAQYNTATSNSKHSVDPNLEARGHSAEAIAQANKHFSARFAPVVSCGLRFTKPFDHFKFDHIGYVYTLFENYERGSLPFPGSTSEQPAQIMEIFSVLSRLKVEYETKAIESVNRGRNQHKNKPRAR